MAYEKLKRVFAIIRPSLSRRRLLSAITAIVICLSIGGGIHAHNRRQAYINSLDTTTQPARKANQKNEEIAQTQDGTKAPVVNNTPPAEATQIKINQPQAPIAGTTPIKPGRRKSDTTNPQWAACIAVQNQQYVDYQAENASVNSEKAVALAELDRMYNAGELEYDEDGQYYEPYEQSNIWQAARAVIVQEYDAQLMTVYTSYEAKRISQQALCEATYDR